MIRLLGLLGYAVLAVPAFAQQSPQPDGAGPPGQETQAPSRQAPPQTGQPPAPDIAQIVATDFPTYDADQNGLLDQAEFSRWVGALRTASPGSPPMSEEDLQAWTTAAFSQADTDQNKSVDQAEMTTFLTAAVGA